MKAFLLTLTAAVAGVAFAAEPAGNRLTYLDSDDPFYPRLGLARFTTPQWVGEEGVEAVVILSIDDLRETKKYEAYLRPVLERLKGIDGRAPVSIMCNQFPPEDPQFGTWLKEGLSLDVHTLTHPCPLLRNGDFSAAQATYHGGVDLLAKIPGNRPVAFRMPCCDSMNSPSPRFFAEIFPGVSAEGRFLSIDSSVMGLLTSRDASLPRELVLDPDGRERFRKYFPLELVPPRKIAFERFASYIEDYPYPYVIGRVCWELPCAVPSDWEAFNLHGAKKPRTLEDWKAALDAIVLKAGVMPLVLHPHGWSDPQQIVAFIDHAVAKHGKRVKFLTFREALERLEKHALAGESLRTPDGGGDNGVRLLDVNNDGFIDVVIGNEKTAVTRVWEPGARRWAETPTPARLTGAAKNGGRSDMHVRFGAVRKDGAATMLVRGHFVGAWHFEKGKWQEAPAFLNGLEEVSTGKLGIDGGVRLRDFDADGRCELLVSTANNNAIYRWSDEDQRWRKQKLSLPDGVSLLNERGEDNGLRFVDLNGDGFDDVLFSNEERYGIYLWAKTVKPNLGWEAGWSHVVMQASGLPAATRQAGSLPYIVRAGPHRNNGAWFKDGHLVIQNEDTSKLEGVVERRSFKELIAFDVPPPKSPEESLACLRARPGFKAELVAAEPLVVDPIAFEWDARGRLWVVEMRDYPLGMDGKGKPGGVIKVLEDTNADGRYDAATPFLEGLPFPTGVMPWRNGVLVAATPDLFYAEDTDGDGRADARRVLFTGFKEGNQQHRFNGFEYGLDNWICCANGDSGGTVRSIATGATLNLSGRDFRFRPDTGEMQAIEGQAQYGRRCDDWGNWFGNNNPTWLWHYPIPERYLARNPQLVVKSLKRVLANYPEPTRVFPLSVPPIRFNQPQSLNHVTSACSAAPYRDDLFGPEFATSVFISEPVHNVVHREVLAPEGVSFKSQRAADERDSEFLASTDNWFRPTMLKTGPDGALYIADMYRFVLEHPEWIAPEAQARLDLRAGEDKGRIYRVVPEKSAHRPIPNLAKLETA
ncbi:MAG: FG-GAP-like repeat-containing protein, partial [Verrucomicrobiota bacterium]|nr:FG-GAP-like repeat-containing protein [Verrucomicrobiota bacterium]